MKVLRRILVAACIAVAALSVAGCAVTRIKDIKLISAGVKYVVPTSMRTFDAMLMLGIDNPAMTFQVQDVQGAIRADARPIATFTGGRMQVEGKKILMYELPCTITLEPGVSILDVLKLCTRKSMDGIILDVDLRVASKNGTLKAPLHYKDINLSEFSK